MRARIAAGDRPAARHAWLSAHAAYHRIGAAYGAFGAVGDQIDGLAHGLPRGTADTAFTGFHRIELGLWSASSLPSARTAAAGLDRAVRTLRARITAVTLDPNDLSLRAHEILEDTARFTLTGEDDYGSGSGWRTARADLYGTRELVRLLAPLLRRRDPSLVPVLAAQSAALAAALERAGDRPVARTPRGARQSVNAATGALLESLAPVPDLLEIKRTP
jgi:high-affinity iron transporter